MNRRCDELYQLAYMDTPSLFDTKDFISMLLADHKSLVKQCFMSKATGGIRISLKHIDWALRNQDDDELIQLLSIFRDIVKCQQMFDVVEEISKRVSFSRNKDGKFKTTVYLSSGLKATCNKSVKLFSEAFFEVCSKGLEVESYTIGKSIVKTAINQLGYSDDEFYSHLKTGKAFFFDKLSQEEELNFLPLILDGDIVGDGCYGLELYKDIESYYQRNSDVDCISYYNKTYSEATEDLIKEVSVIREDCYNRGGKVIFVDNTSVAFSFKELESEVSDSIEVYFGSYLIDNMKGRTFQLVNRMLGLGGEYISLKDVARAKLITKGLPINMHVLSIENGELKDKLSSYFSIHNVVLEDSGSYINSLVGVSIDVSYSDLADVLSRVKCNSLDDLEMVVRNNVDVSCIRFDISEYSFKQLVGKIIRTLVCIECDIVDKGRTSSNHLLIKSGMSCIDDYHYKLACLEAERIITALNLL